MKLDFDMNSIRRNKIELLDCQIDLILKSLEFYCYTCEYIFPRCSKSEIKEKEEDSKISLIRDTYEQILEQFGLSKENNKIKNIIERIA